MEDEPLPNICRVCLAEGATFQSIFVPDESTGSNIHLAEMIMSYAAVQITLGDGLPEQICTTCAKSVSEFYVFKLKCEETDKNLRDRFGKFPLRLNEDEGYTSNFKIDTEEEEITIKAESCEDQQSASKEMDTLQPHTEVEVEPENVVESLDIENAVDDCIEPEEIIANDSIDPFLADYDCSTSNNKFYDSKVSFLPLKTTLGSNDNKRKYVCEICEKKFIKNYHLNRHMKTHAVVKPHVCLLCNKSFAKPNQLAQHINNHSGIKPHVCKICTKGFNQLSNLKDHMRTHNGEKPFLCSTCGKGFNQLGNLRQHTVRHSGIKAHLCNMCGNGFASKGELGAHLRKHTGARPFVCSVCNHGFTTSSSLTKHKRIHSGEKPYECEVCKMKFSRSGILARHRRTHTGEKPYVCKYCSKAFSQSNDLSSHLRIHTGEKPFICDVCGQAFRQSSALKTHKKTHIDKTSLLTSKVVISMHSTFLNTLQ